MANFTPEIMAAMAQDGTPMPPPRPVVPQAMTPEADDAWSTQTPDAYHGDPEASTNTNQIPDDKALGIDPATPPGPYRNNLRQVLRNSEVDDSNKNGVPYDDVDMSQRPLIHIMPNGGIREQPQDQYQYYGDENAPRFREREYAAKNDEMRQAQGGAPTPLDQLTAKMVTGTATKAEKLQFYDLTSADHI